MVNPLPFPEATQAFQTAWQQQWVLADGLYAALRPLMWLLQVQVTDQPLTSLEMMENGRIAAVGSADGSTTIVQFSDGLVDMQLNEKQALTSVSCSPCRGCA